MTGGKIPCPRYIEERVDLPARRGPRSARRHAPRLHGRRERSDQATSATATTRTCGSSSRSIFGLHYGRRAGRPKRRTRSSARRSSSSRRAARRRRAHQSRSRTPPTLEDRRALPRAVPRRARVLAQPATSARSSSACRTASRARSASARSARRRTSSTAASTSSACAKRPSRRATRTSSSRSRARTRRASANIRDIISQTARLEFKLLDDDTDFFGADRARARRRRACPRASTSSSESVAVGHRRERRDARRKAITYAFMQARPRRRRASRRSQRFKEWVATLDVPPDRELGYELVVRRPIRSTLKEKEAGWRTFFLKSRAEITGDMIRDAARSPDQSQGGFGRLARRAHVHRPGRPHLRAHHGREHQAPLRHHPRRRVESAPVIQTRIAGGHAHDHARLERPGDSAPRRAQARARAALRRAARADHALERAAHRAFARPRRDRARRFRARSAAARSCSLFMVVYYHRAGLIADIAVIMNLFLQLAVLASFGASMTLPGIAGLALTIGMSVDANVLINERIREELALGKSPRAAVEIGYTRALQRDHRRPRHDDDLRHRARAVRHRPDQGLRRDAASSASSCSIFTGVVVTRVMFDLWVRSLGPHREAGRRADGRHAASSPVGKIYDFMGWRRLFVGHQLRHHRSAPIALLVQARPEPRHRLQGRHRDRGRVQGRRRRRPRSATPSTRPASRTPDVIKVDDSEEPRRTAT